MLVPLVMALLGGCVPSYRYTNLTDVALYPSSRPIPGAYTVAIPVQVTGCEPDASVANLLSQATEGYDALVQVTVQRIYTQASGGNSVCWEVQGVAVYFGEVDPDEELRRRSK